MQRTTLSLLPLLLIVGACDLGSDPIPGTQDGHNEHPAFPDGEWALGDPEDHELSGEGLAELAAVAEQNNSSCLLVIHAGAVVAEWYAPGFDEHTPIPNVWSVTKSVISAAIGIAEADGLLDIHDRASDSIAQWRGTASEDVTIFDLLTHTSGREFEFFADMGMLEAPDQTAYSLGFGQSLEPGARFDYSNTGTQALEAVLEHAVGGDVDGYVAAKLFEPIGMTSATLGHDPSGNVMAATGLSATCRDLGRFGYLFLRKGNWKGERVIPKDWAAASTEGATELNDAYGYLWWNNVDGHVVLPSIPTRAEFDGQVFPSASDSWVMALGAFGQVVAYDREADLVLVRTTLDYDMSDPLALGDMDDLFAALEAAKLE